MVLQPSFGHQDIKGSLWLVSEKEFASDIKWNQLELPTLWPPVFLSLELNNNSLRTKSQQLRIGRIKALGTLIYEPWANLETAYLQTFYNERLFEVFPTYNFMSCVPLLAAECTLNGHWFISLFSLYTSKLYRSKEMTFFFFIACSQFLEQSLAQNQPLEIFVEWMNAQKSSLAL